MLPSIIGDDNIWPLMKYTVTIFIYNRQVHTFRLPLKISLGEAREANSKYTPNGNVPSIYANNNIMFSAIFNWSFLHLLTFITHDGPSGRWTMPWCEHASSLLLLPAVINLTNSMSPGFVWWFLSQMCYYKHHQIVWKLGINHYFMRGTSSL